MTATPAAVLAREVEHRLLLEIGGEQVDRRSCRSSRRRPGAGRAGSAARSPARHRESVAFSRTAVASVTASCVPAKALKISTVALFGAGLPASVWSGAGGRGRGWRRAPRAPVSTSIGERMIEGATPARSEAARSARLRASVAHCASSARPRSPAGRQGIRRLGRSRLHQLVHDRRQAVAGDRLVAVAAGPARPCAPACRRRCGRRSRRASRALGGHRHEIGARDHAAGGAGDEPDVAREAGPAPSGPLRRPAGRGPGLVQNPAR